jgi:hypothetical protein
MRVFRPMLRWLSAGIFLLTFLLAITIPIKAASDTGTYQILNYITTLEPQSGGEVKITYEQEWQVNSGNIPWVTVGMSNSHYSIQDFSGAAVKVSSLNSGGFTGVRVDLDKTYLPGQTFNIKFAVLQSNLLDRLPSEKIWRINFTPGSYDLASVSQIRIVLISPVSYDSYSSVSPMPTSVNGNIITWDRSSLAPGGRFNVVLESTDGGFLTSTSGSTGSGGRSGGGISSWMVVLFVALGLLFFFGLILLAVRQYRKANDAAIKARVAAVEKEMAENKKRKTEIEEGFEEYVDERKIQPDAQGRYYDRGYGGYITPAIWAAVILSHQGSSGSSSHSSSPVSHCACVSCACACACACAGGGAAGCSRKTLHECLDCDRDLPRKE